MPSFLGHPRVNTVMLPAPVYATWNPAGTNPNISLSNGNLTAELTGPPPGTAYGLSATTGNNFDEGTRYFEIRVDHIAGPSSGIAVGFTDSNQTPGYELGDLQYAYALRMDGYKESNGIASFVGGSAIDGSIVQIAIRAYVQSGEARADIWFGLDGIWLGGGNPITGIDPLFAGALAPIATDWAVRATLKTPGDRITASFNPNAFAYAVPLSFSSGWGWSI